jgi:hypothetical protein
MFIGVLGQQVDAFIMPVAPHAAVMPGRYLYTGKFLTLMHDIKPIYLLDTALMNNLGRIYRSYQSFGLLYSSDTSHQSKQVY